MEEFLGGGDSVVPAAAPMAHPNAREPHHAQHNVHLFHHGHDHHASGMADKLAAIPDELYKKVLLDAKPPAGTNIRARPALGRNNTLRRFGERSVKGTRKKERNNKRKKKNLSDKGKRSTVVLINKLLRNEEGEEEESEGVKKREREKEREGEGGPGESGGERDSVAGIDKGGGQEGREEEEEEEEGRAPSSDRLRTRSMLSEDMVDNVLWHEHSGSESDDFESYGEGGLGEGAFFSDEEEFSNDGKRGEDSLEKGERQGKQRKRGRSRSGDGDDVDGSADAVWERSESGWGDGLGALGDLPLSPSCAAISLPLRLARVQRSPSL